MARVFVTHDDGRFDLADTRRFGSPVHVFDRELYPDNANEKVPGAMRRAYQVLDDFHPDDDFLCLVGSPVYTAICAYVLGDLAKNPVRMLRFDRLEGGYYEIALR